MAGELASVVAALEASLVVVSYNDEAWLSLEDLVNICRSRGEVAVLAFDSKRYIGAQIGIHNPSGVKVGSVSHLRNTEIMVLSGPRDLVDAAAAAGDVRASRPSAAQIPMLDIV
jgi:adenine-specific DNA-methyltransferase